MVFRPISAVLIRHFPIFIPKSHISFYTIRGYPGRIAYSSRFMHLCVALCISYRPLSRRIHEKAFIKRTDHKTPATRAMAPKGPHADERDVCCPRRQCSSLRRTRLHTPAWRTRRRRPWVSGKPALAEPYRFSDRLGKNLSENPYALPISMGGLTISLMTNQAYDTSFRRCSPREIVITPASANLRPVGQVFRGTYHDRHRLAEKPLP